MFIYRHLKPYRKWTCPPIDIPPVEVDIWADLKADGLTSAQAVKKLSEARDAGIVLSSRSVELLSLSDREQHAFVSEHKDAPYSQYTLITCMDVLKKDSDDADAMTLLIVGTESGHLLILPQDPLNSNILCKLQLPSTPCLLSCVGVFDVEWRISVTCRDGKLYSVKNGEVRGSALLVGTAVDLGSQAVAVVKQDKSLWIACMDRSVTCYSAKGKRLKGMYLAQDIAEMTIMSLKKAQINHLLLIALTSGEIGLYRELTCIHSFKVDSPILTMIYGLYGREENSLIIVHGNGALTIKMWRRTAEIDSLSFSAGPPPEQDIPLPVPKKTKLYVEQTAREREKGSEIHRAFQRDLCKLRLTTARAYVKTLTDGTLTAFAVGNNNIRCNISVQGLGPKFLLRISLQNSSAATILQSRLLFSFDPDHYVMGYDDKSSQSIVVPVLLPGVKHLVQTQVMCIDAGGRSAQILCLLYACNGQVPGSTAPLLSASVKMPTSEPLAI